MREPVLARKIIQKIFFGTLLFFGAICGGYIIVGLSWCILGAVLNPEVFLPYAAASATFITFCLAKLKSIMTMWREILREIIEFLTTKMKGMLSNMLDKVIGGIKGNSVGSIG
jgi:hypothetical protein